MDEPNESPSLMNEHELALMLDIFSDPSVESGFIAASYALNRRAFIRPNQALPIYLETYDDTPATTQEAMLQYLSGEQPTLSEPVRKLVEIVESAEDWQTKTTEASHLMADITTSDLTYLDYAYLHDLRTLITTQEVSVPAETLQARKTLDQSIEEILQQRRAELQIDARPEVMLAHSLRTIPKKGKSKFKVLTEAYESIDFSALIDGSVLAIGQHVLSGGSWVNRLPKIDEAIESVDPQNLGSHGMNYVNYALRYLESNNSLNQDSLKRQWAAPIKKKLAELLGDSYAQYHEKAERLRDIKQMLKEISDDEGELAVSRAHAYMGDYDKLKEAALEKAPLGEYYELSKQCETIEELYQAIIFKPIAAQLRSIHSRLRELQELEDPSEALEIGQQTVEKYMQLKEQALEEAPSNQIDWANSICESIEDLDTKILEREREYSLAQVMQTENTISATRAFSKELKEFLQNIYRIPKLAIQLPSYAKIMTIPAIAATFLAITLFTSPTQQSEARVTPQPQPAEIAVPAPRPAPPRPETKTLTAEERQQYCTKRLLGGNDEVSVQLISPAELGDVVENCFAPTSRELDQELPTREQAQEIYAGINPLEARPVAIKTFRTKGGQLISYFSPLGNIEAKILGGGYFGADRTAKTIRASKVPESAEARANICGKRRVKIDSDTENMRCVRSHEGIDFAQADTSIEAVPLYSVLPGRVVTLGKGAENAGTYVVVDHGNGIETRYMHLAFFSEPLEKIYQENKRGRDRIVRFKNGEGPIVHPYIFEEHIEQEMWLGMQGRSGNAKGDHLHFEIRFNGEAKNPANYLPLPDHLQKMVMWAASHDEMLQGFAEKLSINPDFLRRIRAQESHTMGRSPVEESYGFFQVTNRATRQAVRTCASSEDFWNAGICNSLNWNKVQTDAETNILAGAIYTRYLLDRFDGDYAKAAAAYRYGEKRVDEILVRAEDNGWEWQSLLPQTVQRYVDIAVGREKITVEPQEVFVPFEGLDE